MALCTTDQCKIHNELNLEEACIKCLKVKCEKVCQVIANDICTQKLSAKNLFVENETANNLCVPGKLSASQSYADQSYANNLCAVNATFDNACISNLKATNVANCVKWRAAVTFAADTFYVLNTPINWDTIIDDPNGNVTIGPFKYTVPVDGYYIGTVHLNTNSLAGAAPIVGIPTGFLTILVNGLPARTQTFSYLSFNPSQKTTLTSLALLKTGDVVTMKYEVLVVDPISGLTSYVGTSNIEGTGGFSGASAFAIHYLSSLDCQPITCPPCPIVQIPCSPVTTPCRPLEHCCTDGNECDDCGC